MEAYVDNIWSTPSNLHFRIVVVTDASHRVYKQEFHVELGTLDAVDIEHLTGALEDQVDPTQDPAQEPLWA